MFRPMDARPSVTRRGGIDNAFADGLAFLGGDLTDALGLEVKANCGIGTLLFLLRDYNGRANDSHVTLSPLPSIGVLAAHGGEERDAGTCPGQGGPFYPPSWNEMDKWSPEGRALRDEPLLRASGYVSNWKLVIPPANVAFPFFLGGIRDALRAPAITATLTPVGADGRDAPGDVNAHSYRMDGEIAARASTIAILHALGSSKNGVCPGNLIFEAFKAQICQYRDIAATLRSIFERVCPATPCRRSLASRPRQSPLAR